MENEKIAIVITGKLGVGKSALARRIAESLGTWVLLNTADLRRHFSHPLITTDPATVVVEEFGTDPGDVALAKSLVSEPTFSVYSKGQEARRIKTPNFIFVTGEKIPFLAECEECRFMVLEIFPQVTKKAPPKRGKH